MDHLFIGYDKDFYDAIPYVKVEPGPDEDPYPQRWAIEPSFVEIASKLLFQKNNAKVYEEYGLPYDDEIRAFILAHPELLFYAPELKKLWELMGKNMPLYDRFLPDYLRELHAFGGLFAFIERAVKCVDVAELAERFPFVLDAGKGWCAMEEDARGRAEAKLECKPLREALKKMALGSDYSTPAPGFARHECDRIIGGYSFERIASEREAETIEAWYHRDIPISIYLSALDTSYYSVKNKLDNTVAVLETENGELTRIVTDRDVSLTENGLLAAILNWLLDVGYSMGKDTLKEEGE